MTGAALAFPPAEYLRQSALVLPRGMSFAQWEECGHGIRRLIGATSWYFGDWLNYGEDTYNERYSQALEASDLAYQTLRNAAYVCRKIQPERRRPELSFATHAEVAALDEADQELLLNQAVASNLTRNEMRELVKRYKANLDAEINGKTEVASVPPAGHDDMDDEAGVPPAESEGEVNWQAEYTRAAQENVTLQERVEVLATKNDLAQEVARLHEERAQALALVDEKNAEIKRLTGEVRYRTDLLRTVMDALGVERYNDIIPALAGV